MKKSTLSMVSLVSGITSSILGALMFPIAVVTKTSNGFAVLGFIGFVVFISGLTGLITSSVKLLTTSKDNQDEAADRSIAFKGMSTLRELTANSHSRAENTHFMRLFMAKALKEEEYMEYLTQLSVIYTALEFAAEKVGILQELQGIERAAKVRADVAELNKKLGKQSVLHWDTVMYYNEITRMTNRDEILAHFYVRYAGDMYGGQMLKAIAHGSGTMYDFDDKLPVLRQKMRELATPNLADDANMAFSRTIEILNAITKSNGF